MRITINKAERRLTLWDGDAPLYACRVALGRAPVGAKRASGDLRTPEGAYRICLIKPDGKYGRSIGIAYPSAADAELAFSEGRIDDATYAAILAAHAERRRPPWGSPLGGEIYIHEGGAAQDWTAGCIALDSGDMDVIFPHAAHIDEVVITP